MTGKAICCAYLAGWGERQGSFSIPSAITVDEDGTLYVLDSEKGCLQWFSPTPFLEAVRRAVALLRRRRLPGKRRGLERGYENGGCVSACPAGAEPKPP